jgi:hypothetical protein
MHLQNSTAYRFAVGLALTAAFLIVWPLSSCTSLCWSEPSPVELTTDDTTSKLEFAIPEHKDLLAIDADWA